MATRFSQGYYKLKNPEKYIGDPTKIRFMSSWEYNAHRFFDNNKRVIKWASEPFGIPYIKPTDGKVHKYFVDYYCEYIDQDGVVHKQLIELKPLDQVKAPSNRGSARTRQAAQIMYQINVAKWKAAEQYCESHGMEFKIITERSVFG